MMKIAISRMESNTLLNTFDQLELFSQIPLESDGRKLCGKTVGKTRAGQEAGNAPKRKEKRKAGLNGVSGQRRAANERERRRNVRLNQAFVTLKKALPLANIDISKIEILRLAAKWIDHLMTLLKDYEQQRELLTLKHMRSGENVGDSQCGKSVPVRHDCLYHQDPDLKNTLWEDCIGLPKRSCDDNEGCIHVRSSSRFHELFS